MAHTRSTRGARVYGAIQRSTVKRAHAPPHPSHRSLSPLAAPLDAPTSRSTLHHCLRNCAPVLARFRRSPRSWTLHARFFLSPRRSTVHARFLHSPRRSTLRPLAPLCFIFFASAFLSSLASAVRFTLRHDATHGHACYCAVMLLRSVCPEGLVNTT